MRFRSITLYTAILLLPLLLNWTFFGNQNDEQPISIQPLEPAEIEMRIKEKKLRQQLDDFLYDEYIKYPRCVDIHTVVNASRTKIKLIQGNDIKLGKTFNVSITMFDGNGNVKNTGRDHLRARLFTADIGAFSAGNVYDHSNGTYTAQFTAFWSGPATVEIEVLYPSEILAAAYYIRRIWDYSDNMAVFTNSNATEKTRCSPSIDLLEQRENICQYPYWSGKMTWFCSAPKNTSLSCKNLNRFDRNWANYTKHLSKCELELARNWRSAVKRTDIIVQGGKTKDEPSVIESPNVKCTHYNITKLWYQTDQSGFFFKNEWKLTNCRGPTKFESECLQDVFITIWGDSTIHQWFKHIRKHGSCHCKLKKSAAQWRIKPSWCPCNKYNAVVVWQPHYFPFVGIRYAAQYTKSIDKNNISRDKFKKHVLIFHIYSHLQMYSFDFFTKHIVELRRSVELLLAKDPNLKIFIKMPHTHREKRHNEWMIRQPDIIGFMYDKMIRIAFSGLYDKIIPLNNRDSSIALKNMPLHPDGRIVDAMVGQCITYFCDKK